MARQKIYKKLSVVFYEKDAQLFEDFSALALEKDDNMSRYTKRLIVDELEKEQTKKGKCPLSYWRYVARKKSQTNFNAKPP